VATLQGYNGISVRSFQALKALLPLLGVLPCTIDLGMGAILDRSNMRVLSLMF